MPKMCKLNPVQHLDLGFIHFFFSELLDSCVKKTQFNRINLKI